MKQLISTLALVAAFASTAAAGEYLNFVAVNDGKIGSIGHQLRLSDSQTYMDQDCGAGGWIAVAYIGQANHWVPVEIGCWTAISQEHIAVNMTSFATRAPVPQTILHASSFNSF